MFGLLPDVAVWRGQYSNPDIFGEWNEDGVVVLEERICWEFKESVTDAFADGGFVILDTYVLLITFSGRV